jgi:hypothetical protein
MANPKHFPGLAPTPGTTASDGPDGYVPHAPDDANVEDAYDRARIFPPPEASMEAFKHYYRELGAQM